MMKSFLKVMAILFAVGVVFLAGISLYLTYGNFDIEPQDFSDMEVVRRNIPEEENGLLVYREAYSKISDIERLQTLYDDKKAKKEDIEAFLKENEVVINLCDKALTMEVEERDLKRPDDELPYLMEIRRLAHFYALQLRVQPSIQTYLKGSAFAKQYMRQAEALITYLVGVLIQDLLNKELKVFISQSENREALQSLIDFHEGQEDHEYLIRAFKAEFDYEKNMVELFSRGELSVEEFVSDRPNEFEKKLQRVNFLFQPERTKMVFYDQHQRLFSILRSSEGGEMLIDFKKHAQKNIKIFESYKNGRTFNNSFGKIFYAMMTPAWSKCCRKMLGVKAQRSLVRLSAALRLYELDYQRMPESLSQLVPKYLQAVPKDPFDGEKIRYDFKRKLLYSVGEDGIDNGGVIFYESQRYGPDFERGDLLFQLEDQAL